MTVEEALKESAFTCLIRTEKECNELTKTLAAEVRRLREEIKHNADLLTQAALSLRDMVAVESERDRYREALKQINERSMSQYANKSNMLDDVLDITSKALRGGEE